MFRVHFDMFRIPSYIMPLHALSKPYYVMVALFFGNTINVMLESACYIILMCLESHLILCSCMPLPCFMILWLMHENAHVKR